MKIKLLRDSRILHKAGEVVEASPAEAAHLLSINSAIKAETETKEAPKPKTRKTKES